MADGKWIALAYRRGDIENRQQFHRQGNCVRPDDRAPTDFIRVCLHPNSQLDIVSRFEDIGILYPS
jgi:hypothetical protein